MADTENDSAGLDHTQGQTPSRKPFNVGRGIFREIMKFVRDMYGNETLPDDDLGRAVLWELLNQLVLNGAAPDKVRHER